MEKKASIAMSRKGSHVVANGRRRRCTCRTGRSLRGLALLLVVVGMASATRSADGIGQTFWNNPQGGLYNDPENWTDGLPGDGAFDLGGLAYQVILKASVSPFSLSIFSDNVGFELGGQSISTGAFNIGAPFTTAGASMQQGIFFAGEMSMGTGASGFAQCQVGANASLNVEGVLNVGIAGVSQLDVVSGGNLVVGSNAVIGTGSGLSIIGQGSVGDVNGACQIGGAQSGSISVLDGGIFQAGSVQLAGAGGVLGSQFGGAIDVLGPIDAGGQVSQLFAGQGTITCAGLQIAPQTLTFLTVQMPGSIQVGSGATLTPQTAIDVFIFDTAVVPVQFTGDLIVDGSFGVSLGFDPPVGTELTLVSAASIEGTFQTVFLPVFPDDRVSSLQIEDGQVIYRVLESSGGVVLDPPIEFVVEGEPARQDAGNIDTGAGFGPATNDIVVVIPGDDPSENGSIQVFRNDGTDPDTGDWLGFTTNAPVEVGREPSGVIIGEFNGDGFADLAVANRGDDTVSILLNTGLGDGTFVNVGAVTVAGEPSSIGTGDFTEDGNNDLVITGAADGVVQLLAGDGLGGFTVEQTVDVGDDPSAIDPRGSRQRPLPRHRRAEHCVQLGVDHHEPRWHARGHRGSLGRPRTARPDGQRP